MDLDKPITQMDSQPALDLSIGRVRLEVETSITTSSSTHRIEAGKSHAGTAGSAKTD
jgi:hypothetical protein